MKTLTKTVKRRASAGAKSNAKSKSQSAKVSAATDPFAGFGKEVRWTAWKHVDAGDGPSKKVPFKAVGVLAKSNKTATWTTRRKAELLAKTAGFAGIGVFLGPLDNGDLLAGIDLDTCRDPVTGKYKKWAGEIIRRFDSLTEISPSNTGFKIFFKIKASEAKAVQRLIAGSGKGAGKVFSRPSKEPHPPAIALYLGGRFFTVTNATVRKLPGKIRHVGVATVRWLVKEKGPHFVQTADKVPDAKNLKVLGQAVLAALAERAKTHLGLAGILAGDRSALGNDTSDSGFDFALAAHCRAANLSFQEAHAALCAFEHGAARKKDKNERDRQIENAWRNCVPFAAALARDLIVIEERPGELKRMVDSTEEALASSGVSIFQRGDVLVRPGLEVVPVIGERTVTALRLREMTTVGLIEALSAIARFQRNKGANVQIIDCPLQVASALLQRRTWGLRPLLGLITAPTMRSDGTILDTPGYDEATRLFFDPMGVTFPAVPANPTKKEAEKAFKNLLVPFEEFPFVGGDDDRAVVISGLMSALLAGTLKAPMHAITSPLPGSGKSLIGDVISIVATGAPCPVVAQGSKRDEFEKRMNSLLLQGVPMFSIDNCSMPVEGDFLCQVMTQDLVHPRVLGASKIVQSPTTCTVFATGNNLRIGGDMARRSLLCSIDPNCERPEQRTFKRKLRRYAFNHRGQLVAAALTVLRAYQVAGMPAKGELGTVGSFEQWGEYVRDAISWVGGGNAAAAMDRARDSNPELQSLIALLTAWEDVVGYAKVTAKDLVDKATGDDRTQVRLREALFAVAGEGSVVNTRSLGNYLLSIKGRIAAGRAIDRANGRAGVAAWLLRKAEGPE